MARLFKVLSVILIVLMLGLMNAGVATAEPYFSNCTDTPLTNASELECLALVSLYNSTGGSAWTNNSGWLNAQNVDDWFGITAGSGHVTEINLSDNHLVGSIPSSIQDLDWVIYLQLGTNELSGSLPASMGGMNSLAILYLYGNALTGLIPAEFGNLANLTELNISSNELTGTIPPEIGNLSVLHTLQFGGNELSGSIPVEVASLPALQYFYVNDNELSGSIPGELFSPILRYAWLNQNRFSGTIPSALSNAVELRSVYFSDNFLTGELPSDIGNLTKLQYLYLQRNDLFGPIPATFINLSILNILDLGNNGFWSTDSTLTAFIESKLPNWEDMQSSQGVYPLQGQKVGWGDLDSVSGFSGRVKFSKYFNNSGTAASKYKVGIYNDSGNLIYDIEEVTSESVCSETGATEASICTYGLSYSRFFSPLSPGIYQWRVMALDGSTWKDQGTTQSFVIVSPPGVISPTSTVATATPEFTWSEADGAVNYRFEVLGAGGVTVIDQIVQKTACSVGECRYKHSSSITIGDYTWRVRAFMGDPDSIDYTDFTDATFKILLPTPKFPSVSSTTSNPKFTWTPVSGQTRYQVQLYTTAGVKKMDKTLDTSVCTATQCSYTPSPVLNLANGAYKWKVRAGDAVKWGTYSAVKTFNKVAPPAPQTPTGSITQTNPKFTWTKIPGATKYYIVLQKSSGTLVRNMEITTLNCTATTCSYTPSPVLNLLKGDYKWKVRAYNGYYGDFSAFLTFKKK